MAKNETTFELSTRKEIEERFGADDYAVFGVSLLAAAAIGVFFWIKGQKSNKDILFGGRSLSLAPLVFSLTASFMSAITLLGTPSETYLFGTQYLTLPLTYPLVSLATSHIYLPVYFNLNVSTSHEYLEWRFNKIIRTVACIFYLIQMTLYISVVVYAPALAVSQLTGFNVDIACLVIFIVCMFYTIIGGIKAVVWTDTLQSIIMFGSFIAIIVIGHERAGGGQAIFESSYNTSRIELLVFSTDVTVRHTVWGTIIGGFYIWLIVFAANQTQVQRYMCIADVKRASKAVWLTGFAIAFLAWLCAYGGIVTFAYYYQAGCDPIKSKVVSKPDQIFPLFVMQILGNTPLLPGLFVAGVFSGALSTVSSVLNSFAGVVLQDILVAFVNPELGKRLQDSLWTTRALTFGFGVLAYIFLFVVKYLPGVLEAALTIFGILGGPILGGLTLGMLNPWANSLGALIGMLTSASLTMWIAFGQMIARTLKLYSAPIKPLNIERCPASWNITREEHPTSESIDTSWFNHLAIYNVSYVWLSLIATWTVIIVGSTVSLISELLKSFSGKSDFDVNHDIDLTERREKEDDDTFVDSVSSEMCRLSYWVDNSDVTKLKRALISPAFFNTLTCTLPASIYDKYILPIGLNHVSSVKEMRLTKSQLFDKSDMDFDSKASNSTSADFIQIKTIESSVHTGRN